MRKAKVIVLCILCGAGAIAAAVVLLRTDEDRIRARFKAVSKVLKKSPEEGQLALARKMQRFSDMLDNPVRLETPHASLFGEFTPSSLARVAGATRMQFDSLSVSFDELDIAFPEDRAAVVRLKVTVTGMLEGGSGINRAFAFECRLQKPGRQWLLASAKVIPWENE